jgi:hypothetical protein
MNNEFIEIDVERLSTALAEDDWMIQTKSVNTDDLWENIAVLDQNNTTARIIKEVRSRWTTLFFSLKTEYTNLIMSYAKIKSDDNSSKFPETRPEDTC